MSAENRAALSEGRKAGKRPKPFSEEHRRRLSEARTRYATGRKKHKE
jgi:hypothetical protein